MSGADGEISFADTVGRIAEDLDLLVWEALDGCAVEWVAVGQNALFRTC